HHAVLGDLLTTRARGILAQFPTAQHLAHASPRAIRLLWRLLDGERILTRDFPGYAEYRQSVRHRLCQGLVARIDMNHEEAFRPGIQQTHRLVPLAQACRCAGRGPTQARNSGMISLAKSRICCSNSAGVSSLNRRTSRKDSARCSSPLVRKPSIVPTTWSGLPVIT